MHQRPHTWAGDVERLFQLLEEVGEGIFRLLLQRALMQRTFGAEYVIRLVGRPELSTFRSVRRSVYV